MSRTFNAFESKIRESVEHYELPYEPSSWKDLENRLDQQSGKDYSRYVAVAAACLLTAAGVWAVYQAKFRDITARSGFSIPRFEQVARPMTAASGDSTFGANTSDLLADSGSTGSEVLSPSANPSTFSTLTKANTAQAEAGQTPSSAEAGLTDAAVPGTTHAVPGPGSSQSTALMVQSNVSESCAGNEVEFAVKNGPKEGSYLWNFGDGSFSNQPNPKHRYEKAGKFDVSLSITDKKNGQISTTVMNDFITINPSPNADFEWEFVNNPLEAPTVKIVNTSEFASSYEWKFGDGTESNAISPLKTYTDKGKQMVVLEVSNDHGCSDSKVKYIPVNSDYNLMAPERFDPKRETFMPEGLKQGRTSFKLTVYNGEKAIFESTSKNKGWNGTMPDGSLAPEGQYPWIVIIYNESTKEERYFSGLVTLNP